MIAESYSSEIIGALKTAGWLQKMLEIMPFAFTCPHIKAISMCTQFYTIFLATYFVIF